MGEYMTTDEVVQSGRIACSECGKTDNVEMRFVACGSQSFWEQEEGAPTSINPAFSLMRKHWEKDNVVIWPLALCPSCQSDKYKSHHEASVAEARPWVNKYGPLSIAATLLFVLIAPRRPGLLSMLIAFALFGAAFIVFPLFVIQYFRSSWALRYIAKKGSLPPRKKKDAFKGLATSLIQRIGSPYPLPAFREVGEYSERTRKNLQGLVASNRTRVVLCVADTKDKLLSTLPADWKDLINVQTKA